MACPKILLLLDVYLLPLYLATMWKDTETHRQHGDRFQNKESKVKISITTNNSKELIKSSYTTLTHFHNQKRLLCKNKSVKTAML